MGKKKVAERKDGKKKKPLTPWQVWNYRELFTNTRQLPGGRGSRVGTNSLVYDSTRKAVTSNYTRRCGTRKRSILLRPRRPFCRPVVVRQTRILRDETSDMYVYMCVWACACVCTQVVAGPGGALCDDRFLLVSSSRRPIIIRRHAPLVFLEYNTTTMPRCTRTRY